MKKIALLLIFVVVILSYATAQEIIYYNSTPTLQWDDNGMLVNGDPILPEDEVVYEVYLWDTAQGDIKTQVLDDLTYFGTSTITEIELSFTNRYNWAAAIRTRVTQADGNVLYSELAYTTSEPPETETGPFVYAPTLQDSGQPESPYNLRDSGI